MRIAFLIQDSGKIYGAERAVLDLARELKNAGAEVSLLLIEELRLKRAASEFKSALEEQNFAVKRCPVRGAFSLSLVRRIREYCRANRVDVLHCIGYKADVHGRLAVRGMKAVSLVSTIHGWLERPDLKERFYKWMDLLVLRRFDAVIALSRYYHDLLIASGVQPERVHHIPSAFYGAVRQAGRREQPSDPLVFGMLGRLSWEKNHDLLLDAAKMLSRQPEKVPFRVLIAGEGPRRVPIQRRIEQSGLTEIIDLPGYMQREAFFDRIDVLVQCSVIENLPYSIMEAMERGVPVIGTRVGGIPDLIEDGKTGWLVEPGDAGGLAEAMRDAVKMPGKRVAMGARAGKKLLDEFQPEVCIQRHMELYLESIP